MYPKMSFPRTRSFKPILGYLLLEFAGASTKWKTHIQDPFNVFQPECSENLVTPNRLQKDKKEKKH